MAFLQQPYVFALATALLTATLAFLYSKTTEREQGGATRTFFKTLASAALAGVALTYFASGRAEPLATEPFDPVGSLPPGMVVGGI